MSSVCNGLYLEYADGDQHSYLNDERLMEAIEAHATEKFWDDYKFNPETKAGLRRYQSYLRREARRRGLGRLVDKATRLSH